MPRYRSGLRYGRKPSYNFEQQNPFTVTELIDGVYRYTTKIVGITHVSNLVLRGIKRTEIIKDFLFYFGNEDPVGSESEIFDLELMKYGKFREMENRICSNIRLVVEENNIYDSKALAVVVSPKALGLKADPSLTSFIDVGYIPKHHKDKIFKNFEKYFLVKYRKMHRGIEVDMLLVDDNFTPKRVSVESEIEQAKFKKQLLKASFTSARKLRSLLEVE